MQTNCRVIKVFAPMNGGDSFFDILESKPVEVVDNLFGEATEVSSNYGRTACQ
jgi:hypothetical protein